MAQVCVGCGLTTDDTGRLIVAVSGAWPHDCDQEDLGAAVYCGLDGVLRVDPSVLSVAVTNTGGFTPGVPATIVNGGVVTVDTIDIDLQNPSECYSANVLLVVEAEVDIILPVGSTMRLRINSDQVLRYRNRGSGVTDSASWQMARGQTQVLLPNQLISLALPIDVAPLDGDLEYTRVQWRASALIVASQ